MTAIRPIRSKVDHEGALREIERLWGADPNSEDGERLEILCALVERYEEEHFSIDSPDPIDAIKFMMEQNDRTVADLGDLIGSAEIAASILERRRPLTLEMIRAISAAWGLPADALIRPYPIAKDAA